jgi:hypothetical protein
MVNLKIGKNRNRLGHKPLKTDLIKILYPGKKTKKATIQSEINCGKKCCPTSITLYLTNFIFILFLFPLKPLPTINHRNSEKI